MLCNTAYVSPGGIQFMSDFDEHPSTEPLTKKRTPMNRSLTLTDEERDRLRFRVLKSSPDTRFAEFPAGTLQGNSVDLAKVLPQNKVDLLILDPPYNLDKDFDGYRFSKQSVDTYTVWLDEAIQAFKPLLKQTASVYICGDWFSSFSIFAAASRHFIVRNRITWEREKGRGAKSNWKNSSEDIWFCTVSDTYTFNVEAVKLRRKVLAPYRDSNGTPKDWSVTQSGNYRDTHPSNIWTDITVPFWSMSENTIHPTQKSEKLIAKLVLASTNPGDQVLDPYLGSGTSSVVCKKLGRRYLGIELNEEYCLLAERRLELAQLNSEIQGLSQGVFWERNTLSEQYKHKQSKKLGNKQPKINPPANDDES
jgi:site-specific DNA-methyltransferase (adenine-specific)